MRERGLVQALCKNRRDILFIFAKLDGRQLIDSSVEFPADAVSTMEKAPNVKAVEPNQIVRTQ